MKKAGMTELQIKNILRQSNKEQNAITRECIESALVLLMKNKPFAEISIQDIIKRAGVSRSSYYRNYDSKEAILTGYLDKIINDTSKALSQFDVTVDGENSWMTLLSITRSLSSEYKLLLQAGFGDTMLRRYIYSINRNNPENDPSVYTINCYLSGCLYSVITQWILDDMKTDEAVIAKICTGLMFDGLSKNDVRKCVVE